MRHPLLIALLPAAVTLAYVPSALAACDPAGLDACVSWAQTQVVGLGCHTDPTTFHNIVEDLYLNTGCRMQGTSWTNVSTGVKVSGGFSGGVNTDSAGCIARYTPAAYLKSGGYFRTPKEGLDASLRNKSISGCEYDSYLGKKDAETLTPPIIAGITSCRCANGSTGTPAKSTNGSQPPKIAQPKEETPTATGTCPGDHRVKLGHYCVCEPGYEVDTEVGGCRFITEKTGLGGDDVEKITEATKNVNDNRDQPQKVDLTLHGKPVHVAIVADAGDVGAFLYTTDGVHFSHSLNDAINGSAGKTILSGIRTFLTDLSPFNWFGSTYKGDDKDLKYNIARQLGYDDIDDHRSNLVGSLKYMSDFQAGMAAYIDLRVAGKSPSAILTNDQDIDADIERLTSRLRIAVQGKKTGLSDEDKAKIDAAQKKELYAAFENGYHRYLAAKELQK